MNRYANKSEVMLALEQGGRIESHDCYHWLVKSDGETARIRYNLWNILFKQLVRVEKVKRPPSVLPYYIYKLRRQSCSTFANTLCLSLRKERERAVAKGAYINAVEKLAFIRSSCTMGRSIPVSQILMIVEALQKMIEIFDYMIKEPKYITPEAISAFRQLIEVRVMPLDESAPAIGLGNPGTENA